MSELLFPLVATSPLADLAVAGRLGRADGPAGLVLRERRGLALATVIARAGVDRLGVDGLDLPETPRWVAAEGVTAVWAGPRQWLLLAEGGAAAGGAPGFVPRLARALAGRASVADQSDGRTVLRLAGPAARATLAKLAGIDLHPDVFRPGDVALTRMAQLSVALWQVADGEGADAPVYDIACFSTFAASLWHALVSAGAAAGIEVLAPDAFWESLPGLP